MTSRRRLSSAMRSAIRCCPPSARQERSGSVPIRPAQYYITNWWGGIGVNMNIPIFNGFLYSAQAKEASIRAQAASEQSRELRDQIVRDVRTAWLAANTAYQRVAVTAELLKEANLALDSGANAIQAGAQFDRGTEPGAVSADRRGNRQHKRAIPISPRSRHAQLSDRSDPMIENFKLKVFRVVADAAEFSQGRGRASSHSACSHCADQVARREPRHRTLRPHRPRHQSHACRKQRCCNTFGRLRQSPTMRSPHWLRSADRKGSS